MPRATAGEGSAPRTYHQATTGATPTPSRWPDRRAREEKTRPPGQARHPRHRQARHAGTPHPHRTALPNRPATPPNPRTHPPPTRTHPPHHAATARTHPHPTAAPPHPHPPATALPRHTPTPTHHQAAGTTPFVGQAPPRRHARLLRRSGQTRAARTTRSRPHRTARLLRRSGPTLAARPPPHRPHPPTSADATTRRTHPPAAAGPAQPARLFVGQARHRAHAAHVHPEHAHRLDRPARTADEDRESRPIRGEARLPPPPELRQEEQIVMPPRSGGRRTPAGRFIGRQWLHAQGCMRHRGDKGPLRMSGQSRGGEGADISDGGP